MVINYQLTNSDFLEYQLYASSKSKSHKKRRRNNRFIGPIVMLLYGFYMSNKDGNYVGITISGILGVLWFLFYPIYSKWRYERHFKKHVEESYKNRINKPVQIDSNEDSINAKDYGSESKINGNELKELIETQNHFFIKLMTDVSLVIPKYAVEDKTEFKKRITNFGAMYINELNWKWK